MAETLRELVVALSLDSSNFSRNMRTINAQIKEAESTFRLACAGVENFDPLTRLTISARRSSSFPTFLQHATSWRFICKATAHQRRLCCTMIPC